MDLFDFKRELSMSEAFWQFHQANPHIYEILRKFAFEAVQRRRRKIGMKLLFERVRWHVVVETDTDDDFKLNNNFTAFYARLFAEDHPEHKDLFAFRASSADEEFNLR
jgi:hypothetical protein